MKLRNAIVAVAAVLVAWPCVAADAPPDPPLLLGDAYPIEVRVAFHSALFHWVDSLAGSSGGKTVPAHQAEFQARLGNPTSEERDLLSLFRQARFRDAHRPDDSDEAISGHRGMAPLRRVFLESDDLDDALRRAERLLAADDLVAVRAALRYFRPRYETIWRNGRVPHRFLDRSRDDPGRPRLEALLVRIAGFYGSDLDALPRPAVVLVPVPAGHGTHASAVGPYLLVEIRPHDRLRDQASVIVHENAHFLFSHMDAAARARLEARVDESAALRRVWELLHEALPTALGQGVADRAFRTASWSPSHRWYHRDDVDAFAKALYPVVRETLESGGTLDVPFLERAARVAELP